MNHIEQKTFWAECLLGIKKNYTIQQLKTWIDPISIKELQILETSITIVLLAPNKYKQQWALNHLSPTLKNWISTNYSKTVVLTIEVKSNPLKSKSLKPVRELQIQDKNKQLDNNSQIQKDVLKGRIQNPQLNPDWTFENFVLGKANQLARAAAQQICDNPGHGYNPFFLYGGVGLGKTHLIHAVGNAILDTNQTAGVKYIHAESYVSDVVKAYQTKSFEEFKKRYHSLDILLIDDIQFFAGKSRTQEEFFYAFEALIAAKKQIIITCDTYPTELGGIDNRLISRFGSGLTVAIEPPELEMRVAILLKKAEKENLPLPEDAAFFIAKHLRSNVRELEGALQKIEAYCSFHMKTPSLEVVRDALNDLLSLQKTAITIETIQKTVAEFFKLKLADMYSKRRPASIAIPRQIAMYLSKELTQKSLPEIGYAFGGRDHTTVLHAVKKIQNSRLSNATLNHNLHILEQQLRN
ncbi:MAG: chromosomal replication initiator protein DnaA [Burkholderiaceae bacterium]|nr:chromosomal replication initiator protein DnaA [Pseudomonadota bacterium]RZP22681.1 MAG: chromosomal replication initiator protein DnaA [Burkholderiaceae bacterium]